MKVTKRRPELSSENILKHVSPYDIVHAFWPSSKELKLGKGSISSPFRADPNESFLIGEKDGVIVYKDMGELNYRGDHWNFVRQIEGLQTFTDVLKAVDKKFNLGYSDGRVISGKPQIVTWEQPPHMVRRPTLIQVTARAWQKDELRWWALRCLDIKDLKAAEVYVPSAIYRNRKSIPVEPFTFCYFFPETGKWKLYRPLAETGKKIPVYKRKWDNSMDDLQHIENIQTLKGAHTAIVQKSRKDRMITAKATGLAVCSLQAEDPSAINDEQLKFIDQCHRKISAQDNDKKGHQMTEWMITKGFEDMSVQLDGISDYDEWVVQTGTLDTIVEYYKQRGII